MEAAPGNCTQGLVIAPEVFPELAIPHVRWALNKPGLLGGPKTYGPGVQVFHYCDVFEESAKAASPDGTSIELRLGSLDKPDLTPLDAVEKRLSLWYRGKYMGGVDLRDHYNCIELTRSWPPTKQQYWELMNQAYKLDSYDDCSGVNLEAHLWGLQVRVWNGTEFVDYVPPTYINDMLIDEEKDLERVRAFVNALK
jgi:hypothetical protein